MNSSTNSRACRVSLASARSAGSSISTLKWPVLARIAPSFICSMWLFATTDLSPVAVMKMSPTLAASSIVITMKPSMTASIAFIGSTSVTITFEPMPLARIATPRPHQP